MRIATLQWTFFVEINIRQLDFQVLHKLHHVHQFCQLNLYGSGKGIVEAHVELGAGESQAMRLQKEDFQ